jgi:hypothetical protein
MTSKYTCETCAYAHIKKIPYDDYPNYTETYCDIITGIVDIFSCQGVDNESTWTKLGCASHSDLLKLIEVKHENKK